MRKIAVMLMALMLAAPMPIPEGYTAEIMSRRTGNTVYVHIDAGHSANEVYNCCEIKLVYDAEKLRFDSEKSTLGYAAYRDTDGRLMLVDFGADKPLGKSVYVLTFEVVGAGKAEIQLDRAAFSTAEKAVTEDLEPIINKPDSIAVWVK